MKLITLTPLIATVGSYPDGAHGLGHIGIGVNSDETVGFYPDPTKPGNPYNGQEGKVKDDSGRRDCKRINTTEDQDKKISDYIANRAIDPGLYSLQSGQVCTAFVRDALAAGGVAVPATTISPNALFNFFRRPGLIGPGP